VADATLQKACAIIDDAPRAQAANDCVKSAVHHLTERPAIVGRGELLNTAVEHAMGRATLVDIESEIDRHVERGLLVKEAPVYRPAGSRNGPVTPPPGRRSSAAAASRPRRPTRRCGRGSPRGDSSLCCRALHGAPGHRARGGHPSD